MKEQYKSLDMEVIRFTREDVITSSDENELPED
jgi:hypothetical protein